MERFFSAQPSVARSRLLDAAAQQGLDTAHWIHPSPGLNGEQLAVDVALAGKRKATSWLVCSSGTHGCELLVGSAIQLQLLERIAKAGLPDDVAVLFIHGVNPYGASYDQRQDENWVDLNRAFVDHSRPKPTNDAYARVHPMLLAQDYRGSDWGRRIASLERFVDAHGEKELFSALGPVQFDFDDGSYYGGTGVTWSARTFVEALSAIPQHAERVLFVDLHSGLGPWAKATVLASEPEGSEELSVARAIFPEVESILAEESIAYEVQGSTMDAARSLSPASDWTCALSVEFGTVDRWECLRAAMARSYLARSPLDPRSDVGCAIRARVREAYVPSSTEWRRWVLTQAGQILESALGGLQVGRTRLLASRERLESASMLDLLQAGDAGAWKSLHRNVTRQLRRDLDQTAAPDVAAEVGRRMVKHISHISDARALRPYLSRVIRSAKVDYFRSETRAPQALDHPEEVVCPHPAPAEKLEIQDEQEHLWRLLTNSERKVVELRSEQLSYPEIAATLGVSIGTVGAHLSNARGKFGSYKE